MTCVAFPAVRPRWLPSVSACLVVALPATADARTIDDTRTQKHTVDRQIGAAKSDLDDITSALTRAHGRAPGDPDQGDRGRRST